MLDVRTDGEGVVFKVRVQPRAAANELGGIFEGALRVRVTAPPVEGAANAALRSFLADRLGVSVSRVEITGGQKGRSKKIRVAGMDKERLLALLGLNK